jgi:hypothetical protein
MNDILRQRLARHIESLPEEQVYQVLDYIEFLSSKYARTPVRGAGSSIQRFGERLEDKMRAQGVALRAMKGALDAVGTADRVFSGLSEAGRTLIREVNTEYPDVRSLPESTAEREKPRSSDEPPAAP